MKELQQKIKACRNCDFGYEPNPIVWGHDGAPILQISQAPGRKVHECGKPFSDASGNTLRAWYGIDEDTFYNKDFFYITSVGHCYPGKAKTGDKKPPKCCWELWTKNEVKQKSGTRLIILIGKEAASKFFPDKKMDELVFGNLEIDGIETIVLPHPSPLNRKWLKDHPDFEKDRIPCIRKRIRQLIS